MYICRQLLVQRPLRPGDTSDRSSPVRLRSRVARHQATSCQSLRLLPAALPAAQAYCHYNDSTWGGSVIFHGGLYHLYFSEMSNNCSLHMYAAVSRVVHATSPTPAGPYERRGVALPVLAHNPQIIRNPADGSFLLFHIGATVNARCVPDATAAGATRLQPAPTHLTGARL